MMEKLETLLPPVGTSPVAADQLLDNAVRYQRCGLDPNEATELKEACDKIQSIEATTQLYSTIAGETGLDKDAAAGVHYRESSLSLHGCFQNGDPCVGTEAMREGRRTTHVPRGLGPWPTLAASAIDAFKDEMHSKGWKHAPIGIADSLAFTERFNGLGPRNHGVTSGYNWGGTTEENIGGYSNDGVWERERKETRIGVVAIMKEMRRRELAIPDEPVEKTPIVPDNYYINLIELGKEAGLSPDPVNQLIDMHRKRFSQRSYRYWAVVDFTRKSSEKRLFFFDVVDRKVERHLVAHGAGSDPGNSGYATRFSNIDGSHMSNLGICQAAEIYVGSHGRSLRLDGLEATNSHMRDRAIVMHQSAYVTDATGACGRSWGCPAVDPIYKEKLITSLRGGSLINIWKP